MLVYRIQTEEYVTGADLIESGNLESYDVESEEDFESFNHIERKPVEGRSIFLNHRDLDKLAEEVNEQIQKHRQKAKGVNQTNTVHIVTLESTAGSLRVGLARPKTVIGFPDAFSIGPLWNLPEKAGRDFRREWLFDNINFEQEETEYERKFKNALLEIDDVAPGVPIYIWYGNNGEEQTGLRFYLWLLRDKPNEIFLMNTADLYEKYIAVEDGFAYFHTGFLDSKIVKQFFENEQKTTPVNEEKRIHFHKEWIALAETKDVLRIWRNGQIHAVPEDHYDSLITEKLEQRHQKQANKDFILTAQLIGEIVAEWDEFVDYFYLEYRIRELLYNGTLEIKGVPKSMRHYRIKLRDKPKT
ncbi:MAG TPA: DUF1835 domain-containing protein [Planococcus sp. (in: firmicutes)]|nr:DUF1835 domain-containing protein [Planococcus sp. (in: firmicutes)]